MIINGIKVKKNNNLIEEIFKLGKVKVISTYHHYNLLYNNINI